MLFFLKSFPSFLTSACHLLSLCRCIPDPNGNGDSYTVPSARTARTDPIFSGHPDGRGVNAPRGDEHGDRVRLRLRGLPSRIRGSRYEA
ncbi:hypothetical protein BD626DRAFT_228288 [Schizophyllum amplum]|uniref:Secreted protein n=1 Tax=Schizophyllum amplum TaxID=97359 RepID=A0A550BWM6_9AGAR|nr:hypothetical protein BD626DRAFT_228288 [Auriculariopsis ampla]